METTTRPPVELSESECWVLLREAVVGRLAVAVDDVPDVFPVNHVVDHGTVVFRTAEGSKLSGAAGRAVAFEVDGYDPGSGEAWSVVLKGRAHEVTGLYDVLESMDLPLFPWHASPKPRFVRVEPAVVTGRRFHTVVPTHA